MVETSQDGQTWTVLYEDVQFARSTRSDDYVANTTIDLQGVVAQYVRITCKTNWTGLFKQYSLSEVRFTYIPTRARRTTLVTDTLARRWEP